MTDDKLRNFYELYERRRSIREFQERPIEQDKLLRLLTTLNRAQSAANRQPWHFIVIENQGRGELNAILTKEGFRRAPILIAACADPKNAWVRRFDGANYAWVDVSIAVTEMIGVATAEGIGACWIASLDVAAAKKILEIPDDIDLVALIAIGYPLKGLEKEQKQRKPLTEIIHYCKW